MTEQEHDASLGRMIRHFARFHGGAILTCFILICFFGDGQKTGHWIMWTSVGCGAVITYLLWRSDRRRRKEEEMSGGCDGSTRVYEALRTGSTPVPDTERKDG